MAAFMAAKPLQPLSAWANYCSRPVPPGTPTFRWTRQNELCWNSGCVNILKYKLSLSIVRGCCPKKGPNNRKFKILSSGAGNPFHFSWLTEWLVQQKRT